MHALKREAVRKEKTMSELVEAALRALLEPKRESAVLPPLLKFSGGDARVNFTDRDMLYHVMGR